MLFKLSCISNTTKNSSAFNLAFSCVVWPVVTAIVALLLVVDDVVTAFVGLLLVVNVAASFEVLNLLVDGVFGLALEEEDIFVDNIKWIFPLTIRQLGTNTVGSMYQFFIICLIDTTFENQKQIKIPIIISVLSQRQAW